MYEVHDWAEVHRLFHREEWAKTRIAEKLGMSRNTVSRLLELVEPPRYERAPQGSKLDPFKGSIAKMLGEDARAPATVIIGHLRRDGYDGGITILKEYLQQVRPLFSVVEARQRTSYLPGEIGHTDWWDTRVWVPVGKGVSREAFGLVTTLPHSAAHAAVFAFSKTMADFLPAFSGTLLRLGGVSEKMVVDRDSSIVVPHSRPARLHDEVAALFGGFRVKPVILGRRRPQSKGQVERTIGYLETSFLPLRRFDGIEDLQAQHDQWAREVAFGRYHRRVGAKVGDAWMAERGFLAPLPDRFPDTDRHTEVRVTKDGFCRVGDVDYSVPPGLAGRRLQVRVSTTEVVIFSEGAEIARHRRSFVPADVVLAPAHARALRLAREAKQRLRSADPEIPDVDLGRYDALAGVSS
ncbi:MAG TPA: IS21 family transposase [Acidimicrobiia bacterium]|nr:IS21 family transposase [Acidimicrobiia bacterium]